jgi:steroid 5-alpha reductase family enzyme
MTRWEPWLLGWAVSALLLLALVLAPALILYLVLFVTGVPPAEESSLRSRGEAYRRYRQETSVFVPWFPRRSSTA